MVHFQEFLAGLLVLLHALVVVRRTLLGLDELGSSIKVERLAHLDFVLVAQYNRHTVKRHLLEKEEWCIDLAEKWNMRIILTFPLFSSLIPPKDTHTHLVLASAFSVIGYEVFFGVKWQLTEVFRENRIGPTALAEQQQERNDCTRQTQLFLTLDHSLV